MSTSGTVASTVIDTSSLIEHAFRRVRVLPSAQTPETVLIAQECLYMLLLNLGNRGLNLWCVEKMIMGLQAGKATYITPPGTLDVLNVVHTQPVIISSTFSTTSTGATVSVGSSNKALRVGVKFNSSYTGKLTLGGSQDGVTFTTTDTISANTYETGLYYWFDLAIIGTSNYYSVSGFGPSFPDISNFVVASSLYDLPLTQWSRDTYSAINSKTQQGHPAINYFYEKKLTPTLTLWPVPDSDINHLTVFIHRQPQDVGSLIQQLDIPQRWLDGMIWLLAARLCFELPTVDPQIAQMVVGMADKQVFEAEQSETDGAPIYLTPSIGVYSR